MVRDEIRQARQGALDETIIEDGDAVPLCMIAKVIRVARVNRRTVRLPRHATRAGDHFGRLVTWAIINLALALCGCGRYLRFVSEDPW